MSYRSQMNKTITIGLVALAFVAGSIMTGTMADAAKGNPFQEVLDAIAGLETSVDGIDTSGLATQSSVDDISTALDNLQSDVDDIKSTGNDHGIILGDLQTTVGSIDGKADGIKSVVDTIDAKSP